MRGDTRPTILLVSPGSSSRPAVAVSVPFPAGLRGLSFDGGALPYLLPELSVEGPELTLV